MIFLCLLCAGFVGVTLGFPSRNGYHVSPQRAVMFTGYYSNPLFGRSYDISPQGSMSAVVTRDAVATNTFAGPQPSYPPIGEVPIEENEAVERYTEKADVFPLLTHQEPTHPVELKAEIPQDEVNLAIEPAPVASPEEDAVLAEEVSTEAVAVVKGPKRTPKKKAQKPVKDEDEDDDDDLSPSWPFATGKGSVPSYNAFFPITISGEARARKGEDDEYYPGSATAIANSFSTGKGGIATSHATSFGDPYLASLIRKGLLNFRSKNPQET